MLPNLLCFTSHWVPFGDIPPTPHVVDPEARLSLLNLSPKTVCPPLISVNTSWSPQKSLSPTEENKQQRDIPPWTWPHSSYSVLRRVCVGPEVWHKHADPGLGSHPLVERAPFPELPSRPLDTSKLKAKRRRWLPWSLRPVDQSQPPILHHCFHQEAAPAPLMLGVAL